MLRFVNNWIRVVCLAILWMLAMSCALCTGLQLVLNLDLLNTAVFQSKTSKLCIYCIALWNQRWWWCPFCAQIIFQMDTVGVGLVQFSTFCQSSATDLKVTSFFVLLRTFMVVPFNPWYYLYLPLCILHVFAFFAFIFAIVYYMSVYLPSYDSSAAAVCCPIGGFRAAICG